MLQIAVIEDEVVDQKILTSQLERFFTEEDPTTYQISYYERGSQFLQSYQGQFDLIFFDIQMPGENGMDIAEKLRKIDEDVPIIFVTSMAQYAVRGYCVSAIGFLIKPVKYYDFFLQMQRAVKVMQNREDHYLTLSTKSGLHRLSVADLYYVESQGHNLIYHTARETYQIRGKISDAQVNLADQHFIRCNNGYLVNPKAIRTVNGYDITLLNDQVIPISHPRHKDVLAQLNLWLGGGNT